MTAWQSNMRIYMKDNLSLYIFVAVLFVMGVIFGALMVNGMSLEQKQDLGSYLGSFINSVNQGGSGNAIDLTQAFGVHFKWIVLIFVLGLSVVGLPLILILDFIKGVLVGFSVGFMVGQFSWKGMLLALASVAPQNLLLIPAILICSVTAVSFSMFLIKNRFLQRKGSIRQPFVSYVSTTVFLLVFMLGVSFFEVYVSPVLIHWVTPYFVSA